MNFFFDTSSLFKLCHREADSVLVEAMFLDYKIEIIFLSEIAKVEFTSTVWKKQRMAEITISQAVATLKAFKEDEEKYSFLTVDNAILEQARTLFTKYGEHGLRTLDSVQLSTALSLRTEVQKFICSDKLLNAFLKSEALPTW